ncbi:MAG: hypothetical protein WBV82_29260 [Myxococcaceae bacterium]
MTASAFALIAGIALSSAPRVEHEVSARSEGRLRLMSGEGDAQDTELALQPRAEVLLDWETATAQVSYAPQLNVRELLGPRNVELLHLGELGFTFSPNRTTTVRLSEELGYGEYRFNVLGGSLGSGSGAPVDGPQLPTGGAGQAPGAGGLPPRDVINFVRSNTRLNADFQLSRRLTLTTSAGWEISGGADAPSREQMPLQRGPFTEVGLSLQRSRFDVLSSAISYLDRSVVGGSRVSLGGLRVAYQRDLDRSTDLMLSAGAGVGRERQDGGAWTPWSLYPEARVGLSRQFRFGDQRLAANVTGQFTPSINPFTAALEKRVEARAGLDWSRGDLLRSGLHATASTPVLGGAEDRQQLALLGANAGVRLTDWSELEASLGWSWERDAREGPPRRQWLAGIAFVATTGSSRSSARR